jgi:hypothetical protein
MREEKVMKKMTCEFCGKGFVDGDHGITITTTGAHHHLKCVLDAVVKEEREACAKIADGIAESLVSDNPAIMAARQGQWGTAMEIAEAIRKRGTL